MLRAHTRVQVQALGVEALPAHISSAGAHKVACYAMALAAYIAGGSISHLAGRQAGGNMHTTVEQQRINAMQRGKCPPWWQAREEGQGEKWIRAREESSRAQGRGNRRGGEVQLVVKRLDTIYQRRNAEVVSTCTTGDWS